MHALLGVVGEFLLIGWAFTAVTAPLRCIISDEYRTRRFKQRFPKEILRWLGDRVCIWKFVLFVYRRCSVHHYSRLIKTPEYEQKS